MSMSTAPAGKRRTRYSYVAMALHWAIAALIIAAAAIGLWMVDAIKQPDTQATAFQAYQLHKSLGLTILVLSLARLAWRLINPPPPMPAHMNAFSRFAAHSAHWLFYGFMIAMPLLGWAMVSASPYGLPTIVFGLFEWPHIAPLTTMEDKAAVEAAAKTAHRLMGYGFLALLGVHVAAALKHQFIDRDGLLARMLPLAPGRRTDQDTTETTHA